MSFKNFQSRVEAILQNMLGAENVLEPPQSRVEELLLLLLEQGSTGGEVTAEAVAAAIGNMTQEQLSQVLEDIGAEPLPIVEAVTGTTPTIAAADNHIYKRGEVTSLTITGGTTGEYIVVFTSGATATVLNLPQALEDMMPDDFSVEANTKYEINVLDGWPFVGKKAVSA